MSRFRWDRERPLKKHSIGPNVKPDAYIIKDSERGPRESNMKNRASISHKRRNKPVTLAGKHRVDDEP